MSDAHPAATPVLEDDRRRWSETISPLLEVDHKRRFQGAVGSILYIMHATRPDLAYTIIRLSQFASCPREVQWDGIKRVLRYLRSHALALGNVSALRTVSKDISTSIELLGYFDSAHADTPQLRSTYGYLFLLQGSPISWTSRVQRLTAISTESHDSHSQQGVHYHYS